MTMQTLLTRTPAESEFFHGSKTASGRAHSPGVQSRAGICLRP